MSRKKKNRGTVDWKAGIMAIIAMIVLYGLFVMMMPMEKVSMNLITENIDKGKLTIFSQNYMQMDYIPQNIFLTKGINKDTGYDNINFIPNLGKGLLINVTSSS